MQGINNINFDENYLYASKYLLLLHNNSQTPPVELRHANLLTYVRRFQNIFNCQEYVDNNRQKEIILFTTDNQFLDWNTNINTIDYNLRKLFIYCNTLVRHFNMIRWNGRYKEKIQEVFIDQDLNYYLLYIGLDYVKNVCDELHEDNGLRNKLCDDGKRIGRALIDYFGSRLTQLSQEAN